MQSFASFASNNYLCTQRILINNLKIMEQSGEMTMKDIARALGVSAATVSRALKDSPSISRSRREAIQQFAREHNYVPNAIAEQLRNSRKSPP